jgi:metallo-beta-lactamase class B
LKKIAINILLLFFYFKAFPQNDSIRFKIIDASNNRDVDYYLACNKNDWNPKDQSFKFNMDEFGNMLLICYFIKGTNLEFKITKGSWQTVECNEDGSDIKNRILNVDSSRLIVCTTKAWKDDFNKGIKQHTVSKNVKIIDTAFDIPQLHRKRRIWVYLPEGYQNSGKKYPVMYMQDGQNLFDMYSSGFGEWGVDECLDTLVVKGRPPCIVVGIDNGKGQRMSEYNPYNFLLTGNNGTVQQFIGEGGQYINFIANTLKPFIDKNYKTLASKENTIIAGSSMGGLISYYAMLSRPDIFGKAGIFSPAFWTAPEIYRLTDSVANTCKGKFFFYMGGMEGDTYINDMNKLTDKLGTVSNAMIYSLVDGESMHNEIAWRKWFPEFYNWIMADGFNTVLHL